MPDWKDDRPARERVREIAGTVTDPVSANWVAEQADVGWQTAKDELETLVERGDLRRLDRDGGARYVPDFTRQYTERIRELALSHTREELRDELVAAKAAIEGIQEEYGVPSRADLEASLSDADVSATATRERRQALREWEEIVDEISLIEHALAIHEDLREVDPHVERERRGGGDGADGEQSDTRAA